MGKSSLDLGFWLEVAELAFLRFPQIKPHISFIVITVSSDAKYLDLNLTEANLRCSILTSVFCIAKHFSIVSSFRLMHFFLQVPIENY